MTGFVDQFLHVARQVAGEAQLVPGDRVNEPEGRCVQRLALEIQPFENLTNLRIRPSIKRIPQ